MKLNLKRGLLFIPVTLIHSDRQVNLENVILDTGSAGTVFSIDKTAEAEIVPEPDDPVREIRGIGGTEFVVIKTVDAISIGSLQVDDFDIEIGAMDYGEEIDGIIGLDFLLKAKAKIDLELLELHI